VGCTNTILLQIELSGARPRLCTPRLAAEQIELQPTRVLEGEDGVSHLHYRVQL
jgi:hypothetical protein